MPTDPGARQAQGHFKAHVYSDGESTLVLNDLILLGKGEIRICQMWIPFTPLRRIQGGTGEGKIILQY